MSFETILYVTDFSKNSLKALGPAMTLAQAYGGTIRICHVDEEEALYAFHGSKDLVDFMDRVERVRVQRLEDLVDQVSSAEINAEIIRLKGYASQQILRYTEEDPVDLVATATLGGEGLRSLLMGTTASNVIRHCVRPVLTVGARCVPPTPFEIKRIIAPVDFSPVARLGVDTAAELAERFEATLCLVHAIKTPSFIPAIGDGGLTGSLRRTDHRVRLMEEEVTRLSERLGEDRVQHEVSVAVDEAEEISAMAVRQKGDLIVMTRRGAGILQGVLFGRIVEEVVKTAPVPVLLLPGNDA
jgi:nucleotide-binding universal stress UspA family protein